MISSRKNLLLAILVAHWNAERACSFMCMRFFFSLCTSALSFPSEEIVEADPIPPQEGGGFTFKTTQTEKVICSSNCNSQPKPFRERRGNPPLNLALLDLVYIVTAKSQWVKLCSLPGKHECHGLHFSFYPLPSSYQFTSPCTSWFQRISSPGTLIADLQFASIQTHKLPFRLPNLHQIYVLELICMKCLGIKSDDVHMHEYMCWMHTPSESTYSPHLWAYKVKSGQGYCDCGHQVWGIFNHTVWGILEHF